MSYRVDYRTKKQEPENKFLFWRLAALLMISLCFFCFLVASVWPEGEAKMTDFFLSFRNLTVISCFDEIAADFRNVETITDAFSGFFSILGS